jgi:hypothetical protein
VRVRRADRIAVDALGRDALAAPALDRVVDAKNYRPARHEGVEQQAQQQAGGDPPAPSRAAEDAMVVDEPALAAEAR